jgi:hypothetical protein
VREIFTPGSVRGAARKGRPYRSRVVIGVKKIYAGKRRTPSP